MRVEEYLRQHRDKLVDRWLDHALSVYSDRAVKTFKRSRDPFANPVGNTLRETLGPLFDALLDDAPQEQVAPHLDRITRIRGVQDMAPSRGLAFMFQLKDVIRQGCAKELKQHRDASDKSLQALDDRIDRFAGWAFDSFVGHRERLYKIRVREVMRRVSTLIRMHNVAFEDDAEFCMPGVIVDPLADASKPETEPPDKNDPN